MFLLQTRNAPWYSLATEIGRSHHPGKIFHDADDVKSRLIQFSAGKNQKFYEHATMTLPERWQKMIDENEQYLIE